MRTRLYGVTIELTPCVEGLPQLAPIDAPDLTIELGDPPALVVTLSVEFQIPWYVGPHRDAHGNPELTIYRLPDQSLWMRYSDGVGFRIGPKLDQIQGWWNAPRELGDALGYLLGPVLGLLLRLRGQVCLHASGTVIDGSAHLFLGSEGAGKSTTTAALVQRGHRFLTDDIAPLTETPAGFVVQPGVPRIFLESSSMQALGVRDENARRQSSTWDKTFAACLPADPNWCHEAAPIKTIFVLRQQVAARLLPVFQPLEGNLALANVVAHTYANRTLSSVQRAHELTFVSHLLEHVRVVAIDYARGFDCLMDLCLAIETDIRRADQAHTKAYTEVGPASRAGQEARRARSGEWHTQV
jgi:hypothetical protein